MSKKAEYLTPMDCHGFVVDVYREEDGSVSFEDFRIEDAAEFAAWFADACWNAGGEFGDTLHTLWDDCGADILGNQVRDGVPSLH